MIYVFPETDRINIIEIKTNHLEQQLALLSSKLETSRKLPETPIYCCEICDKEFNHKANLKSHKEETHNSISFECDECQFKTKDKMELTEHKETLTPLSCAICKFETRNLSELEEHRSKHMQRLCCMECNFQTTCSEDLVSHQSSHIKILSCTKCSYKTINNDDLAMHMDKHGTKCDQCSYHAIHKRDLNRHKRTMHMQEQRFNCDLCAYTANSSDQFKVHKESHRRDVPFHCEKCNFTTSSRSELHEHHVTKHGPQQRTRIFSARRQSISLQPKNLPPPLFRPWSSSAATATRSTSSSPPSTDNLPRPFKSNATTLPQGFFSKD